MRRRDRDEQIPPSPSRKIRQAAAHRPRAIIRVPRVVNRRHHREDVHRNVDAAGDRGNFTCGQPALRIDTVGEHDDCRPLRHAAFTATHLLRHRPGRFGDRVEERRLAERWIHVLDSLLEPGEVGGELRDALQPRIEREQRCLVAFLERAQKVPGCLLRVVGLRAHAHTAADVKEHRYPNRTIRFRLEPHDSPPLTPFDDDEVVAREVGDEPAFLVPNHRADRHQIHRGPETRRLLGCRRSRLGLRGGQPGPQQDGCCDAKQRPTPRHGPSFSKEPASTISSFESIR